ncbi:MAG: hypothetical protein ABSC13_02760 [Dehalococcoidia bacterium]|jgi:hypothetical protein
MADALVLLQDFATIFCAGFNAAYFSKRWAARGNRASHRVGSAALAVLNAAVAVESVFSMALYWTYRWQGSLAPFFWPPAWLSARLALLAGAAFISALILRQERRR